MSIKTRNKVSAAFSMSSLTDIIFLLLIFFMLTSTLVSPNALNLLLPSSNSQTQATQTVTISINKDKEYFVGTNRVPLAQIPSVVQKELTGQTDKTIVLNADKSVPIEYVVEIMSIANDLNVKMILATKPK
jgi:biopolymer transport protein ExbD